MAASVIVGILISLSIIVGGLAIYYMMTKDDISEINKEIGKARIDKLIKEVRPTDEVAELRKALEEQESKNQSLEEEISKLKSASDNETVKQKYPTFPKSQLERIEIQRTIARNLMNSNGGTFHISQILKSIESLYSRHVRPSDRLMLLKEIKTWIERDPLCKIVKTGEVQHYTFI